MASGPKVLLIEDYDDNARIMIRSLEPYGFQVFRASDGETGLRLAIEERPDIILLDLGLPDVEGQTIAGLIKSRPELNAVPVVAVTAWPPDTARYMAQAYGCAGYISKPIDVLEFPEQVKGYLKDSAS